ncbi:hypothetical protein J4461_04480 [Candidatus Pacearchaeota archaeon]|nr:hypothetical protein [Candidatus Pacearchaeota archaeon]
MGREIENDIKERISIKLYLKKARFWMWSSTLRKVEDIIIIRESHPIFLMIIVITT